MFSKVGLTFFIYIAIYSVASLAQLIPFNTKQKFTLQNEVRITDLRNSPFATGYRLDGSFNVASIWNSEDLQLLRLNFDSLELSKKPQNTRKTATFRKFLSTLKNVKENEFLIVLQKNKILKFLTKTTKGEQLLNFQRGIASLFQFQYESGAVTEEDVSGECSAVYQSKSSTKFEKFKNHCNNWALKIYERNERPLGVAIKSSCHTEFSLTQDGALNKINSKEKHVIQLEANEHTGNAVEVTFKIVAQQKSSDQTQETADNIDTLLSKFDNFAATRIESEILHDLDLRGQNMKQLIKKHQKQMTDEEFGKFETAEIMTELLPTARVTSAEEFIQILKSNSGHTIRLQLLDLLGAAQTMEAFKAVKSVFDFANEEDLYYLERYLQALSISTRPEETLLEEIFKLLKSKAITNVKLETTLIQTIAAMARRFAMLSDLEIINEIELYFASSLNACKDTECKLLFIQGYRNLQSLDAVPILIKIALEDSTVASVAAMKAIHMLPAKRFDEKYKNVFGEIFYQLKKKHDSTARILALDILLEMKPNYEEMSDLLTYLTSSDKEFEVKTYLVQKVMMLSEKCPRFRALVKSILRKNQKLHNYDIFAQKGLTTALWRVFSRKPSFNESLTSFQEVNNGILKQGTVNMLLEADQDTLSLFKLGLFTSGLSSFVAGSSTDDEPENQPQEDEAVTAGMEITVQNVFMRPLEFFNGQTELVGHVWGGTASDPTPAYQATVLLHDHEEYLLLHNGDVIYFNIFGSNSIDLKGQIQISLWNKNSHSQVDESSGTAVVGNLILGNPFIRLENSFKTTEEQRLSLIADVDFYSEIKLCIQLERPNSILRHTVRKSEKIFNKKYSSRSLVSYKYLLSGSTLALNQKNNEMCNTIHL